MSCIILLACPRSGSSMTAGLFQQHGVWVGKVRPGNQHNPKGVFENTAMKNLLKREFGHNLLKLSENPPPYKEDFKEKVEHILEQEGYQGGPWLCKHSALYWRMWVDFDPKFICIRRDLDQCVKSNISCKLFHGVWNESDLYTIMRAHHREMDLCGGVNVYTDELLEGDYSSLRNAFEYCGLELNEDIVNDWIEPKYWHHVKKSSSRP